MNAALKELLCLLSGDDAAEAELVVAQPQFLQAVWVRPRKISSASSFEIRFEGKEEARLKPGSRIGSLSLVEAHPLLLDYQEPWKEITFVDGPIDTGDLLRDLRRETDRVLQGWRLSDRYLNYPALKGGYGMLASAPQTLVDVFVPVCEKHGLRVRLFDRLGPITHRRHGRPLRLLLLGRCYVIAERFTARFT